MSEQFDYEGALRRLIDKRFEANQRGQNSTPEIHELEQWLYAQLRRPPERDAPGAGPGFPPSSNDDR